MARRYHFHALYFSNTRCLLTKYFCTSSCNLSKCDNSSLTCDKCCHSIPYVIFKH